MGISGSIRAICISDVRGIQKTAVDRVEIELGWGIGGDAHGGAWHRQISLISGQKVDAFNTRGADVRPGAFGENLVVDGIDFATLPVGTTFSCGEVLLEMTQIGKECHSHCQIYHKMGDCIMPREGVFAKVLRGGTLSVGDVITAEPPRRFRAVILTLSDKGSAGQREDKSGDCIQEMLGAAGFDVIERLMLPDERGQIEAALCRFADKLDAALVLTTGGTGFSPRDVTPEATLAVADRVAPGIAEAMRQHSMQITKRAMLSRGAAVLRGGTLIVNLPGSPKAVRESLEFILPELPHGLEILRGMTGECARV